MAFEEHGTRLLDMAMAANMFKPDEPEEQTDDKTKEGTEFQHNLFPHRLLDTGQEIIVIVVKRTYEINLQGKCDPSTEQFEVLAGDIFYGNDPMRSVRFEKDFVPYKYGCDVVINGRAYAPQGFPTAQFDATFRLGSYEKTLRIIGKRTAKWVEPPPPPPPPKNLKEGEEPPPPPPPPPPEISRPEQITSVPLRWEYAYGGKSLYIPPIPEEEEEEQPPEDPAERKKWEKEKKKQEKEEEKAKKKKKKKGEEEEPVEEKPQAKEWDGEKMMPGKDAQKASAKVAAGKKNWDFEPTPKAPSVKDAQKTKEKGDADKDKGGDDDKSRVVDPKDLFFRKEGTLFLDVNKLDEEKEKEEARRYHQKLSDDHDEVKKKTDTKEGQDWMRDGEKSLDGDGQSDDEGQVKKKSRAEMIRDYLLEEGHQVDTESNWEKPDQEVADGQTRVLQIGKDDSYEGFEWVSPYMKPVEKQKTQEEELEEGTYRVPYFRNDIGKGYILHNTPEVVDGTELPNIEDPENLLTPENLVADLQKWQDQPVPAGFGVYKVSWFPRAGYAGCPPYLMDVANQNIDFCKSQLNMDELDPEQRKVIDEIEYPEMKLQFYNCAAMGLTFHKLHGDEEITLLNMSQNGRLTFKLPGEMPFVTLDIGDGPMDVDCPLDTVYIMPDEMKLVCVWRGHTTEFPGVDRWQEMKKCEVTVNRMTPAQMAAARAKAQKPEGGTMVLSQDELRKLEMEEAELKYRGMRRDAVDRDGTHVIFVDEGDSGKAEKQYRKQAEKEAEKGGSRKRKTDGTKIEMDIADLPDDLPDEGHVDDIDKDKKK